VQYVPDMISPLLFGLAAAVTLFGGFVKGAVGFAMPMIMISGMASFMPPELALAALIVPTVLANLWQALRGGALAAWQSVVTLRVFILTLLVFIALSAQAVGRLSSSTLYLILGVPIALFAASQLFGWRFHVRPEHRRRVEVALGAVAGLVGGLSGVWGPPTVAYLTATDTPKKEAIRVQGVVYAAGAVVLFFSHLKSGVLNAQTLPLSLWMLVPAMIGMGLGFRVQDQLDQGRFRRATLAVLIVAGLNLIRRGLMG
jgi:uncharacterized protein